MNTATLTAGTLGRGSAAPVAESGGDKRVVLSGEWTLAHGRHLEQVAAHAIDGVSRSHLEEIDVAGVTRLDTMGAHLINQIRLAGGDSASVGLAGMRPEFEAMLEEVSVKAPKVAPKRAKESRFYVALADIGGAVVGSGLDLKRGVGFLGAFCLSLGATIASPSRFRINAFVAQLENVAFRSVPIIVLISFLVGAIVSQQGVFQMERFGAVIYVIDLIGILILRELAVLLTSIMIAGRSGSAITAEIGSMKMREEIDALHTMGLDPMDVLLVPRVLALIVGLPILSFISSIAALCGGGLVIVFYGGISPEVFFGRLQNAIALSTFFVGLIKAPFMALVIGLIAAMEGMSVQGSAESLGRQTTTSVVKSIFMVIVVDGLFAMFFAAIHY